MPINERKSAAVAAGLAVPSRDSGHVRSVTVQIGGYALACEVLAINDTRAPGPHLLKIACQGDTTIDDGDADARPVQAIGVPGRGRIHRGRGEVEHTFDLAVRRDVDHRGITSQVLELPSLDFVCGGFHQVELHFHHPASGQNFRVMPARLEHA